MSNKNRKHRWGVQIIFMYGEVGIHLKFVCGPYASERGTAGQGLFSLVSFCCNYYNLYKGKNKVPYFSAGGMILWW